MCCVPFVVLCTIDYVYLAAGLQLLWLHKGSTTLVEHSEIDCAWIGDRLYAIDRRRWALGSRVQATGYRLQAIGHSRWGGGGRMEIIDRR